MTETDNSLLPKKNDVNSLQDVIKTIDALSQEGCSEIEAIANLAMSRLESGMKYGWQFEAVYQALSTIRGKAQSTETCINSEAEGVGCSHKNQRQLERLHTFCEMSK